MDVRRWLAKLRERTTTLEVQILTKLKDGAGYDVGKIWGEEVLVDLQKLDKLFLMLLSILNKEGLLLRDTSNQEILRHIHQLVGERHPLLQRARQAQIDEIESEGAGEWFDEFTDEISHINRSLAEILRTSARTTVVMLHYHLPQGSKIGRKVHDRVASIFPFEIPLGSINFYRKIYRKSTTDDRNVLQLHRSLPNLGDRGGVEVIFSHERAEYYPRTGITVSFSGRNKYAENQFVYEGYKVATKPIVLVSFPGYPRDLHAVKILAHELMHVFRKDRENIHCNGLVNGKRCIMNNASKEDQYASDMELVALSFCHSCYDTLKQISNG
jgi:hypothetical protein